MRVGPRAAHIESLVQDIRYSLRRLTKAPGFTAIAVVMLALGIGANTAIFSVVHAVMLEPLPYPEPQRLVRLWETKLDRGWEYVTFSEPNFLDFQALSHSYEDMGAFVGASLNLTGSGSPERLQAGRVTTGFFPTLGIEAILGRTFTSDEDVRGGENRVVLLSSRLWRNRFGSDAEILGKSLILNEETYTVVGVLPEAKAWLEWVDLFVPMIPNPDGNRNNHRLSVTGRLKPDVNVERARSDMASVADQLEEQYPGANEGLGFRLEPFDEWLVGDNIRRAIWILMGAVGFVLVIACANLANLLLAQATGRRKEIAICSALGAKRARVVRQMFTESVLLALFGAGLGILLAHWGVILLKSFEPGGIPRIAQVGINGWALGFTLVVATVTGIASGSIPAFQAPQSGIHEALKEGGRGPAGSGGRLSMRSSLVVVETALSLMLLVGAGLMIRSFAEVTGVETGFRSENRLTFEVNLSATQHASEGRTDAFLRQFLSRVQALPGVESAAAVSVMPVSGMSTDMGILAEGQTAPEGDFPLADWRLITPQYFRAIGIPLIKGRTFTDRDSREAPKVAIISQSVARRLWPGEDPVGRRIQMWADPNEISTVVGVVGDMRERGLERDPTSAVYLSYYQYRWYPVPFIVHTAGEPGLVVPAIRSILTELDENLPISDIRSLDEIVATSVASRRFNMLLIAIFAGVALVLALAGIYGVMAYSVSQRTSEIGIRVALGARPASVFGLVVGQAMRLALVGIVIGLVASIFLSRFLSGMLFGISSGDPLTYATTALLLAATAMASCLLPALRAARLDPVTSLRDQ